jgi:hypothetical protein
MTAGGFTKTTNGFDFRWTSPQRLDEDERDMADDVYSFGCVCYYVSMVPWDRFLLIAHGISCIQGWSRLKE